MTPPPPRGCCEEGSMLAVKSSALSDSWLAASGLWVLGLDGSCGPHFPRVLCTHELPQPQDLLSVPAWRGQD